MIIKLFLYYHSLCILKGANILDQTYPLPLPVSTHFYCRYFCCLTNAHDIKLAQVFKLVCVQLPVLELQ